MAFPLGLVVGAVAVWIFIANAIARRLAERWEALGEVSAFVILVAGLVLLLISLSPIQ